MNFTVSSLPKLFQSRYGLYNQAAVLSPITLSMATLITNMEMRHSASQQHRLLMPSKGCQLRLKNIVEFVRVRVTCIYV